MVHGCEKFVLISTDKAVNPTNIMGASKRLCEMIIQAFAAKIKEGKAYEIPPLFTHERDMIEKPEIKEALKTTTTEFVAVRFGNVLGSNAGTYAHGGEIFVLDMGEPVKITTLARNLIRLSGYTPDVDIKLEFTGLRPGEKLYEEKLMAEEGLKKTKNDLIHIGCPIPFDINEFLDELDGLLDAAYRNEDDMKERVQKIVSTYHPA